MKAVYLGIAAFLLSSAGILLVAASSASSRVAPNDQGSKLTTGWVAANGVTEGPRRELPLRSEVGGTIGNVAVKTNQDVNKGDVLFELENSVQQAQVHRAEALLKNRKAECDRIRDLFERTRNSGAGSSTQEKSQGLLAIYKGDAEVEVAQAELELARAELRKMRRVAPWSGRVLEVYDEPGAQVGPTSARPVMLLADVSRRRVRAFIEELDSLRVREGQKAIVTVDGLAGHEFFGRVSGEIVLRMDREGPHTDAPGEYQDIYYRAVLIDLEDGRELPLHRRVNVRIEVTTITVDGKILE